MIFNYFRIAGDLLHLVSIILLLRKIVVSKSCAGISLRTQELYALVYVTRYLDLFWNHVYLYNSIMKVLFLGSSFTIIYLMRVTYEASYRQHAAHEESRSWILIVICAVLALIFNDYFEITEILWTFSIYLEAVAIVPQLFLLQRTKQCDNITSDYIFCLGGYRALYILNWIYRWWVEENYVQWIVWIAGVVQTGLYIDFFYYYFISKWHNQELVLPQ